MGHTIDTDTSLFAVIGHPVAHSMSPVMHNAAFAHMGYNGVYVAMDVTDIRNAVAGLRALGIRGASITIPHKVDVMDCLDAVDGLAEKIGAVNTIVSREGILTGYNTDGAGAVKALSAQIDLAGKAVTIIGAGGAARAVGFAVSAEGGNVAILNRSTARGEALARELGAGFMPLQDVKGLTCDIVVNTTSVGMSPAVDSIPIDDAYLEREMVVMDIVYNPLKTRLLQSAMDMGCNTVDGVAMFVHQGAMQFELWTGLPAPVNVMRDRVIRALEKTLDTP